MNIVLALDVINAKSLADFFASHSNYSIVASVSDGQSAIDSIVNHQPDFVVLDLVLPKLDGFAVLDFISNKLVSKKPIVIVTSALSQDAFVNKALASGASDFIAKPFSPNVIKEHIDSLSTGGVVSPHSSAKAKAKLIEEQITNVFLTIGIPAHIKGYQYLREAIKLTFNHPTYINNITKELYPAIAQKFETSPSKVERAIRHAIEIAWNRGRIESINTIFGMKIYSSQDRPTNSEFIALVADKMLLDNA